MTQAAEQCRVWIISEYPGTPVSRFACRNTASGGISQHSAYGSPGGIDSNAIDVFGPGHTDGAQDQAWIQAIVDTINNDGKWKWSIRKILWRDGGAHENHAHIDFYPMVREKKWCGAAWTPSWKHSNGSTVSTRDPQPENGIYDGSGGGKWSMDADQVLLIDHTAHREDPQNPYAAEGKLILGKNRHGGGGGIPIKWNWLTMRCEEVGRYPGSSPAEIHETVQEPQVEVPF